jgi:hypothetical protein
MTAKPKILASPKQVKLIDDLFNDLGFLPSQKRSYLQNAYGKNYPDELLMVIASELIRVLLARKEQEEIDRRNGKLKL